jgi:hypothetical protein
MFHEKLVQVAPRDKALSRVTDLAVSAGNLDFIGRFELDTSLGQVNSIYALASKLVICGLSVRQSVVGRL